MLSLNDGTLRSRQLEDGTAVVEEESRTVSSTRNGKLDLANRCRVNLDPHQSSERDQIDLHHQVTVLSAKNFLTIRLYLSTKEAVTEGWVQVYQVRVEARRASLLDVTKDDRQQT